jgi:hypothetical protein
MHVTAIRGASSGESVKRTTELSELAEDLQEGLTSQSPDAAAGSLASPGWPSGRPSGSARLRSREACGSRWSPVRPAPAARPAALPCEDSACSVVKMTPFPSVLSGPSLGGRCGDFAPRSLEPLTKPQSARVAASRSSPANQPGYPMVPTLGADPPARPAECANRPRFLSGRGARAWGFYSRLGHASDDSRR